VGVDYGNDDVATRYVVGRGLGDDVLARWNAAVVPFVPSGRLIQVLDLGAGTGIFTRAWTKWSPSRVIAVEPSPAMRSELRAAGLAEGVGVVAGRGEALALRGDSVDVAWLSTVLHHLEDRQACATELRRVLVPGGVVLIRGLFSDRDSGPTFFGGFLPGEARARAWFPSTYETANLFTEQGFEHLGVRQVEDAGPSTVGEAIDRIEQLRGADSLLAQFTDEELEAGLTTMRNRDAQEPLSATALTLMAFRHA
jgi:SAM-dependent methyltransferase